MPDEDHALRLRTRFGERNGIVGETRPCIFPRCWRRARTPVAARIGGKGAPTRRTRFTCRSPTRPPDVGAEARRVKQQHGGTGARPLESSKLETTRFDFDLVGAARHAQSLSVRVYLRMDLPRPLVGSFQAQTPFGLQAEGARAPAGPGYAGSERRPCPLFEPAAAKPSATWLPIRARSSLGSARFCHGRAARLAPA